MDRPSQQREPREEELPAYSRGWGALKTQRTPAGRAQELLGPPRFIRNRLLPARPPPSSQPAAPSLASDMAGCWENGGSQRPETPLTFLSPGGSLGECENSLLLKGFPHAVYIASFHSKTSNPSTQQPAGHTACLPARTPVPARQGAARGAPSAGVCECLPASRFLGSPGLGHCAPGPSKTFTI